MVNSAWSGQLEVEFLLQVFTIRQASVGLVFGFLFIVRQNAARSDRRRRQKRRFSTVADNIDRV
jgi:hypothetical protein